MRKIKFRGKDCANIWWFGSLVEKNGTFTIRDVKYDLFSGVKPETVGQFTGLYDKKGKEIYEGDILTIKEEGSEFYNRTFVKYIEDKSGFCRTSISELNLTSFDIWKNINREYFFKNKFEVIGNIHENKELLK